MRGFGMAGRCVENPPCANVATRVVSNCGRLFRGYDIEKAGERLIVQQKREETRLTKMLEPRPKVLFAGFVL